MLATSRLATSSMSPTRATDRSTCFKVWILHRRERSSLARRPTIRVDTAEGRVIVGHGRGALAVIDAATRRKIGEIRLREHPEGFQLDSKAQRIFVNLPDERSIVVVDSAAGKEIATWSQVGRNGNYPMALDHARQHVLAVFRSPALLATFAMADGAPVTKISTCSDSDDMFVDAKRHRAYVSCGEGFIDVIDLNC